MILKPMRSVAPNTEKYPIRFPVLASPKLDGIRLVKLNGKALSKSLKPIPNLFISKYVEDFCPEGLDCEVIVGPPNVETTYNTTFRGVMSTQGEPDFKLYAFDLTNCEDNAEFRHLKLGMLALKQGLERIQVVNQVKVFSLEELNHLYDTFLLDGYEGLITKDPRGLYKFGRSTPKDQVQLKWKPEDDFDAKVLEVIEAQENLNEAFTNEVGETARTSHQENKEGKGMVGSFLVKDVDTGRIFSVGAGKMKHEERKSVWLEHLADSTSVVGRFIKYRSMTYGVKDGARHGRFYSWRGEADV